MSDELKGWAESAIEVPATGDCKIREADNSQVKRLPSVCSLADYSECPPPPEFVIEGLASVGDVAMINGSAGIGKTMLALHSAVSVANGTEFLGLKVKQGDVLFINPEMRQDSIARRAWKLSEALGLPTDGPVHFLNTAGFSANLDEIRHHAVEECSNRGIRPKLIVVDSLYLANTGDENSAGDMTSNMLALQALAIDFGAAALFVHHSTKGPQLHKEVLDRASGSGVLGRFVAAQASLGRLDAPSHLIAQDGEMVEQLPFRLEWGKARHTALPKPLNLWFGYPVFRVCDTGELDDKSYSEAGSRAKQEKAERRIGKLNEAMEALAESGNPHPTIKELAEKMDMGEQSARRAVDASKDYEAIKHDGQRAFRVHKVTEV